jgi:signal peptidase complex subunit 3
MNSVLNRLNIVGFFSLWVIGIAAILCAITGMMTPTDPYVRIYNPELTHFGPHMGTMMYHTQKRGNSAELRFDLDLELSTLFNWNVKQLFIMVTAEYPSPNYRSNIVTVWDTIIDAADKEDADMYLEDVVGKYRLNDMAGPIDNIPLNLTVHWERAPVMGLFLLGGGRGVHTQQFLLNTKDIAPASTTKK